MLIKRLYCSGAAHELMRSITSNDGVWKCAKHTISEAIELLCKAGIDLTHPRNDGLTPLHMLCQHLVLNYREFGHQQDWNSTLMKVLSRLIAGGAQPLARFGSQDSLLNIALQGYEIERKETISRRTRHNLNRFLREQGDHLDLHCRELVLALVEGVTESHLVLQTYKGQCLLMWAVNQGFDELTMRLIDTGADVDVAKSNVCLVDVDIHNFDLNEEFFSSLSSIETLCLRSASEQVINRALAKTKSAFERNAYGLNLLHLACMGSKWHTHRIATTRAVIAAGIDVNQFVARKKQTALDIACALDSVTLVELLLQSGADPNIHGPSWGPIHEACSKSYPEVVTALLPHLTYLYAVDTDVRDLSQTSFSLSPLELACLGPGANQDLVQKLLEDRDKVKGRVDISALTVRVFMETQI